MQPPPPEPQTSGQPGLRHGFTLIEVLVVVAILALLVAILLPSLKAARQEARIVACQANCRQIGNIMASYQSEYMGYVPVLLNFFSATFSGNDPARVSYLSVALRSYDQKTRNLKHVLGGLLDPDRPWDTTEKLPRYVSRFLPDYYVCPFERSSAPSRTGDRVPVGRLRTPYNTWELFEWQGKMEHYHSWIREEHTRGKRHGGFDGKTLDGVVKHTALTWNRFRENNPPTFENGEEIPEMPGAIRLQSGDHSPLHNAHRKWTTHDARRLRSGGLSDLAVLWCAEGEHVGHRDKRINYGSHSRDGAGGTNVIFADSHVEYTKGTRIGWP